MDWLTFGVSIYAALIATIVAAWTAHGIWRDRAAIRVEVVFGYVSYHPGGAALLTSPDFRKDKVNKDTRLVIRASNTGRRPVYLESGGLRFRSGNSQAFLGEGLGKTFPIKLDEGQSGTTWAFLTKTQAELKKRGDRPPIWAYFKSEAGIVYKSRVHRKMLRVLLES